MAVEPSRYTTNGQRGSLGNVVSRLVGSKMSPAPQRPAMGFFTDTSRCIGCNGCGYCVVACPFGVIARDEQGTHTARKCTLCYDRMKDGIEPACAKACPTDSIQFGEVEQLKAHARERLGILHERGVQEARLYGVDDDILEGGLNSSFLLLDEPEVYNLPENPQRPSNNVVPASLWTIVAATILGLFGIIFFRE